MNRDEINEVLYFGKAKPWQATTGSADHVLRGLGRHALHRVRPEQGERAARRDGAQVGQGPKYRLRPDGQVLALNIQFVDLGSSRKERLELKAKDWEASRHQGRGQGDRALALPHAPERRRARLRDLELRGPGIGPAVLQGYFLHGVYWNHPWSLWHQTRGKQGSEPPAEIRRYYEKIEQWAVSLPRQRRSTSSSARKSSART